MIRSYKTPVGFVRQDFRTKLHRDVYTCGVEREWRLASIQRSVRRRRCGCRYRYCSHLLLFCTNSYSHCLVSYSMSAQFQPGISTTKHTVGGTCWCRPSAYNENVLALVIKVANTRHRVHSRLRPIKSCHHYLRPKGHLYMNCPDVTLGEMHKKSFVPRCLKCT